MKVGSDRKYTSEFREAAVKQVIEGGRAQCTLGGALTGDVAEDAGELGIPSTQGPGTGKAAAGDAGDGVGGRGGAVAAREQEAGSGEEILKNAAAYFAKESMRGTRGLKRIATPIR
jgi:transposase-like protein